MTLLDYAKFYVSKGFSVIPIKYKDKTPLLQSWKEYQKRKPTNEEITEWFKNGSKNIALVTGAISGVAVVDLDSERAVEWATKNGLMTTPTQKTGKGYHLFFKYTNGTKNTQRRPDIPDIDIRGEGGYVVVSPSIHQSGNQYQWVEGKTLDDLELADFPTILLQPKEPSTFKMKDAIRGVNKGNRNDTLARLTGSNLFRGLSLDECLDFAYAWNEGNNPPLPIDEVERTVRSIFERHEQQKKSNSGYFIDSEGNLCKRKFMKDGQETYYQLGNYDARITKAVVIDDGATTESYFSIIGRRGNIFLPEILVKTSQFESMNWVISEWGHYGVITKATPNAKNLIREYIQETSGSFERKITYSHTGWRVINGSWCYLTGNGAIGCDGVEVDLSLTGVSEKYCLPLTIDNDIEGIRASLGLLDVADRKITIPLFAITYLSTLITLIKPKPILAGIYITGQTGSLKTTLMCEFLNHFGAFDFDGLLNFESTSNSIQKKISLLRDTLVGIDDNRPAHNKAEAEKKEKICQDVIRLTANKTYKSRLNPDTTVKKDNPINSMLILTGEDTPMGESTLLRVMVLEMSRDLVNFDNLTQSQKQRHLLPYAMSSFIHWVIPNIENIRTFFDTFFHELRGELIQPNIHIKLVEQYIYSLFSLTLVCRFLQEKSVFSEGQAKELIKQGQEILMSQILKQATMVQTEDPIEKFKEFLETWLISGKARLSCKLGVNQDLGGALGEFLGWYDDYHLYLLAGATWDYLMRYCHQHNMHFPFSKQTFYRMLVKRGLIEVDENTTTKIVKIRDKTHRVLKFSREILTIKKYLGCRVLLGNCNFCNFCNPKGITTIYQ